MTNPDPPIPSPEDIRLTQLLRADPLPSVPANLAALVRRRLRRRKLTRAAALAATILVAVSLLWVRLAEQPGADLVGSPPSATSDVPGASVLFAAPPVDTLDVLTRQQSAYLTALGQTDEVDR